MGLPGPHRAPEGAEVHVRPLRRDDVAAVLLVGRHPASQGLPEGVFRQLGRYALVAVTSGSGTFDDALGHRLEVRSGDLLVLFPDVPHRYGPKPGTTWSEVYAVFDGPVFGLWRQLGLLDPDRPVRRAGSSPEWAGRLLALVDDAAEVTAARRLRAATRPEELFAEVLGLPVSDADDPTRSDAWLARALDLLARDDGDGPLPLAAVARRLGLSEDAFRRRFRRLTGVTPFAWRQSRRMQRAGELLAAGLSGRQVARQLGFCDEFYFSRRFRQVMGTSPRQFVASAGLPPATRRSRTRRASSRTGGSSASE